MGSRKTTYGGTAGVILDFSDILGAPALSLLLNRSLSVDMIRLEVIIVIGMTGLSDAGKIIYLARPGVSRAPSRALECVLAWHIFFGLS